MYKQSDDNTLTKIDELSGISPYLSEIQVDDAWFRFRFKRKGPLRSILFLLRIRRFGTTESYSLLGFLPRLANFSGDPVRFRGEVDLEDPKLTLPTSNSQPTTNQPNI